MGTLALLATTWLASTLTPGQVPAIETLTKVVEGDMWALVDAASGVESSFLISERFRHAGRSVTRFNEDSGAWRLQSTSLDEGLVILELTLAERRLLRFEPPLVIAPTIAEEGARYRQTVLVIDHAGTQELRRGQLDSSIAVLGPLTLETPAGRFPDAVGFRIDLVTRWTEGEVEERSWTEWYAPGVGLVRIQRADASGASADLRLVEAKVGSQLFPPHRP
jgi:hypothetical protein